MIVYLHVLIGGPGDGDEVPGQHAFESIVRPDGSRYEAAIDDDGQPVVDLFGDAPSLEVITPDDVCQAPIVRIVRMYHRASAP